MRKWIIPFLLLCPPAFIHAQYYPTAQTGEAAYYADYMHGRATAMGEIYDRNELTCAHPTHPKGTLLRVTHLGYKKSVVVRVNDRGPFGYQGHIIDLSLAAANAIGLTADGVAMVSVEVVGYSDTNPYNPNKPSAAPSSFEFSGGSGTEQLTARGLNNVAGIFGSSGSGEIRFLPPGQTGYAIQVGSYKELENAKNQLTALQRLGIPNLFIYQKSDYNTGAVLNKIVIATFTSRPDGEAFLETLKSRYQMGGFLFRL